MKANTHVIAELVDHWGYDKDSASHWYAKAANVKTTNFWVWLMTPSDKLVIASLKRYTLPCL